MVTSIRLALVASVMAPLLGCTTPQGHDRAVWRFETFHMMPWHGFCSMSRPVVSEQTVFVAGGYFWNRATHLYALDEVTGTERWRAPLGGTVGDDVRVTSTLVLAAADGQVSAHDRRDGRRLWAVPRPAGAVGPWAIDASSLYVGEGRAVSAYALADGRRVWTSPIRAPLESAPVSFEGQLYLGLHDDDRLVVLEATTGAVSAEPRPVPGFNGRIRLVGERLLLSGGDGAGPFTRVMSLRDGAMRTIARIVVAVDGDVAYFEVDRRALLAHAVTEGRDLWTRAVPWNPFSQDVALAGMVAIVTDNTSRPPVVRAFALGQSRALWTFETRELVSGVAVTPAAVVVASEDCAIYAVRR